MFESDADLTASARHIHARCERQHRALKSRPMNASLA